MKKIIALMLVLLLMLTMFVACKKKTEPEPDAPVTEDPSGNPEDEIYWDSVGKAEKPYQSDGEEGIDLPILPFQ